MRKKIARALVHAACLFLLQPVGADCRTQEPSPPDGKNKLKFILSGQDRPMPESTGEQSEQCRVKEIRVLADGTRPDFSPDGKRIAFDKEVKGTYELFIMNTGGTEARCLTCDEQVPKVLRGKHKGKATFHPDGKYLLFGAENEHGKHKLPNTPGIGDDHDFWVRSVEGDTFWRLTELPEGHALQYPRFSPDGRKLLFSERYEKGKIRTRGSEYGLWSLKLAEFEVTEKGPALVNMTSFEPGGKGFYEPHGFSPDGEKIIFTAALDAGKPQVYGDIYTYDLTAKKLVRLTESEDIHDEQALYSPDGKKISLMSGPFVGFIRLAYRTELYLMDADGRNRVRLTHFNESGFPEYTGGSTLIDKNAWNPEGTEIVSAYHVMKKRQSKVFKILFAGACGKQK